MSAIKWLEYFVMAVYGYVRVSTVTQAWEGYFVVFRKPICSFLPQLQTS